MGYDCPVCDKLHVLKFEYSEDCAIDLEKEWGLDLLEEGNIELKKHLIRKVNELHPEHFFTNEHIIKNQKLLRKEYDS